MTDHVFVTSSGEQIPIIIDTRRGLRNITLRPKTCPRREVHVSKPWLVTAAGALRFIEQKRCWIERIFAAAPQKIRIKDGDVIEFLGRRVSIRHDPNERSNYFRNMPPLVVRLRRDDTPPSKGGRHNIEFQSGSVPCAPPFEGGLRTKCGGGGYDDEECELVIGGAPEMLEHRVRDFIKKEFLGEVKKIIKTAPLEFCPARIAIRDTSSRWGSRSSTGTISFSWRLALAPYEVMRYVIMHELAHIKHMDHSPHFWATVAQLYGPGVGRAKLWLSKNGQSLHRYF